MKKKTNWLRTRLWHKTVRRRFSPSDYSESAAAYQNPGRGWYQIYSFNIAEAVREEELLGSLGEGETLALVLLDIGDYKDGPIDPKGFAHIQKIFDFFARHDREMIVRIVYDREGKGMEREPAFFGQVQQHMKQIGPLLWKYAKSIYTLQGIFVGNWGEMHSSKFLAPHQIKILIKTLWESCRKSCFLAVRKPSQWRMLFHVKEQRTIPVGLYDDGILGSPSHMGTFGYKSRKDALWEESWQPRDELEFESILCRHVPNGGEVTWGEGEVLSPEAYITRLRQMHISYLNGVYDAKILRIWKEAGVYQYIGDHLGYRFLVKAVRLVSFGRTRLSVTVENTGFARFYGLAEAAVIYQDSTGKKERRILDAEIRDWDSGKETTFFITGLPSPAGSPVKVFLELKEKKNNRTIRFANKEAGEWLFLGTLTAYSW